MKKILLCLTAAFFTAATSHATVILVNFTTAGGLTTGQPDTWNNFTGTVDASTLPLVTSADGATGYSLTLGGGDSNSLYEDTGTQPASPPSPFTPTTVTMSAFFQTGTRTFTLSGLDPALTYSISLYSYINRGDTRLTRFSAGGTNSDVEPSRIGGSNSGQVATFTDLSPTAGSITITASSQASTNWILNGMSVSYVPEPSTALLGLSAGFLFCGRRRRD